MHSTYTYQSLDNTQTAIRLLTLNQSVQALEDIRSTAIPPQLISGSIRHVSLDEEPSYKALSYAWGDLASPKYPILIDGSTLLVTPNLYQALQLFQTLPGISSLWIDAICINQIDDKEKSRQVPLMHTIFSQAEEVLIWLGPAANQSSEIISFLIDWASKYTAVLEVEGFEFLGSRYLEPEQLRGFLTSISDGFPADLWLQPVTEFLTRPWWNRVWVMQELILAKKAIIYCGYIKVDWKVMERAIEIFSYPGCFPRGDLDFQNFGMQVATVAHLRRLRLEYLGRYRNWKPGLSWEELLSLSRWPHLPEATDERDRVYGLMALLNEEDRNRIAVDYSPGSTLARLLFDVSCVVIGRIGPRCMVLCNNWERRIDDAPFPGLPTWSPNWLSSHGMHFNPWDDVYNAARGTTWEPKLLSISFANPKFRLRGVTVDYITKIWLQHATAYTGGDYSSPTFQKFKSWSCDVSSALKKTADVDNLWWLAIMPRWTRITDTERQQLLSAYEVFSGIRDSAQPLNNEEWNKWNEEESASYRKALRFHMRGSFVTSNGHPGIGYLSVQENDKVVIFEGCSVPFTIRQREDGAYYLIGPCYVLNIMNGEVMEDSPEFQDITLV